MSESTFSTAVALQQYAVAQSRTLVNASVKTLYKPQPWKPARDNADAHKAVKSLTTSRGPV